MHVDSSYAASKRYQLSFPKLKGSHRCEVAIIGSGLSGISAALELTARGYKVTVVEAEDIAWGASGRSGGQIIAGVGDHAANMIAQLGLSDAQKAFAMSIEAMDLIKERVAKYKIDCDLSLGQMEVASKPGHVDGLHAMADLYQRDFNYSLDKKDADQTAEITGSCAYFGSVFDPLGGLFTL